MSLGRRQARHETVAAARTAGVNPEDYWSFKPGQKVMTADGFAGVVAAVDDGPIGGAETYEVTLDNGMGGGQYTASLLRAMPQAQANVEHKTAADDYPELGTILVDRPPLALTTKGAMAPEFSERMREVCAHVYCNKAVEKGTLCAEHAKTEGNEQAWSKDATLQTQAWDNQEWDEARDHEDERETCTTCQGDGEVAGKECTACEGSGREDIHKGASNKFHESDGGAHEHDTERCVQHLKDDGHDEQSAIRICKDRHKKKSSLQAEAGNDGEKYGTCSRCGDTGVKVTSQDTDNGTKWVGLGGECSCSKKQAAYDHGDPDEYTSGHKCPNCASDRSLESANGVIKCEDCGYEEQNGQKDGWGGGKTSLLAIAAVDPEFRFHITASYADVRNKAKRLRSEGGVHIIAASDGTVVANVKGDTAVYETEIVRMGSNAIAQWHCGCKWGSYTWGRSPAFKKFEGRLCSHALALHFEAQSQGMFGRSVTEQEKAPGWLKPRTRVVVDFDKDDRKNVSRPAQPRKRDVMRSYAKFVPQESPLAAIVAASLDAGYDEDEILVSLACAGITATIHEAGENPKGPPKSHHKDRSGDLAPCSRGGCGHPEGIHGEDEGMCQSQGCGCTGFQRAGAPKEASLEAEARRKKTKKSKKRKKGKRHVFVRATSRAGGYGAWWHGIGYGGWGGGYGLGGGFGGGTSGAGTGDAGGGGDGGGGDGGGGTAAAGDIRPVLANSALPDTMDPTYTPGNDVRNHDGSHGMWNATRPHDPNTNPASTGFASQGDPKEFDVGSHTDMFASTGSLAWPTIQIDAGVVDKVLKPVVKYMAPQLPGAVVDTVAPISKEHDTGLVGQNAPLGDYKPGNGADKAMPKWLRAADEMISPYSLLPEKTRNWIGGNPKDAEGADAAVHPVGWAVNEVAEQANKIPGVNKVITTPNEISKGVGKTWKKLFGSLDDVVTAALQSEGAGLPIPKVDIDKTFDDIVKGWDNLPDWVPGAKAPEVPAPRPPLKNPEPGGRPGDSNRQPMPTKPGEPQAPDAPVPGKPGTGTPVKPRDAADPELKGQPQRTAPNKTPKGDTAVKPGAAPKGEAPKGPKSAPKASPKVKGGPWMIPPLPQFQRPDYYLESNNLIGGHGIGTMRASKEVMDLLAAEAALTEQEQFANGVADKYEDLGGSSLPRYEAELNDEPEPALPTTDGAQEDEDSLETTAAVEDIVAQFQATAGAAALAGGGSSAPGEGGDVAAAAREFLAKESMKTFSPHEQKEIIDEGMDVTAANLDRLNIEGTHYEALEAALASQTDDDDLEL